MQDLAAMETKKQTFTWKKPSSFMPTRRSVSGMKSLLPLKLLSPTLPVPPLFASLPSSPESAFEAPHDSTSIEQSRLQKKLFQQDGISSSYFSPQLPNRHVPIYSPRGSPLPGLTFYDDGESRSSSSEGSLFSRNVAQEKTKTDIEVETESNGERFDEISFVGRPGEEFQNWDLIRETEWYQSSRESSKYRRQYSDMSFQCLGEKLVVEEGAWLSSAWESPSKSISEPKIGHKRKKFSVESWLSDASTWSYAAEDLEFATALSPAKANVVNVNQVQYIEPSINKQPNMTPNISENHVESCPPTPPHIRADGNTESERRPYRSPKQRLCRNPPACHFAMVIPSPLVSSQRLASVSEHPLQYLKPQLADDLYHKPLAHDSVPPRCSTFQDEKSSVASIMTSIEEATAQFPDEILLLNDPLLSSIRDRLCHLQPAISGEEKHESRHPLRSPIALRSEFSPQASPYNARRMPYPTTSPPLPRTFPYAQFNEAYAPHRRRPPSSHLNTQSLRRIFPHSTEFLRSALYIHLLVHAFITSLPRQMPPRTSSLRDPQAPSHFTQLPPRAVAVPRLSRNTNEFGLFTRSDEVISSQRVRDLGKRIRKCIYKLISVIDSNCGTVLEDFENVDLEFPSILIRSLEEIVMSCEGRVGRRVFV